MGKNALCIAQRTYSVERTVQNTVSVNGKYFSIPIFQKPRACLKNITLSLNLLNKTNILILEFFCIVQEVEAASAKMNKLQVIPKIKEDQKTKEEKKCLKKGKNF